MHDFRASTGSLSEKAEGTAHETAHVPLFLSARRDVPVPDRTSICKSHRKNSRVRLFRNRNTFFILVLPCGMHMHLRAAFDFYKQTTTACNAISS